MEKKYEEVELFCNKSDWEKVKECFNEDGFRILLEFSDLLLSLHKNLLIFYNLKQ